VGLGTVREMGTVKDCLDCKVPYNILGTKILSFCVRNLKNAELLPGLYSLSYLYVVKSREASSKWNFSSVVLSSIYTGVLLAVTVI
jgi:hypothetical protein